MSYSPQAEVDPLAWLRAVSAGDDAAAAVAVGGATPLAGEVASNVAPQLGGTDPAWAFTGADMAQEVLQGIGQICSNNCPIQRACVEERCRLYRLEDQAEKFLGLEGYGYE
jgi:hypothetical protein